MTPEEPDRLAQIRKLYFGATPTSIQQDFERAIELLKGMQSDAERERAAVYMEGLAEMRREFRRGRRQPRSKTD